MKSQLYFRCGFSFVGSNNSTNETGISHQKNSSLTPFYVSLFYILLFPVFGSTPSCPTLYPPCPCSDREIHTWRTLSVGYCMFTSRHRVHIIPDCDSCLHVWDFPNASHELRNAWKTSVL